MQQPRFPYTTLAADAFNALVQVSTTLGKGGLGKPLLELVYTRVSQINGCGYCLDMHTRALRGAARSRAASIRWPAGARVPSSASANAQRWRGRRR